MSVVLEVECEGVTVIKFWEDPNVFGEYRGFTCTSVVSGVKSVEIPQRAINSDIMISRAFTYASMFAQNKHITIKGDFARDLNRIGSAYYLKRNMSDPQKDCWDMFVKIVFLENLKLDHDEIGNW